MIEHLGTILRRKMEKHGFGVNSLARYIGSSGPNISNILHCRRGYTAKLSCKLDCAFGDEPGTWWRIWTTYQLEKAMELSA